MRGKKKKEKRRRKHIFVKKESGKKIAPFNASSLFLPSLLWFRLWRYALIHHALAVHRSFARSLSRSFSRA